MKNNDKDRFLHLYEITKALYSSMDIKSCLHEILRYLSEQMGMKRGFITILDRESGEIHIEVAYGLSDEEIKRGRYKIGEGVTGKVIEEGEAIVLENVGKTPLFLDKTGSRRRLDKSKLSFIAVPVKDDYGILGTISVDMEYNPEIDLEKEKRFLTILSSLLAQKLRIIDEINRENRKLREENLRLRMELGERYRYRNIVGESKKMREVYYLISQIENSDVTVLLLGESGTGKELVANAIHYNSLRKDGPFIKLNCAALPYNLVEAELFGYERGAFTGAIRQKIGKFEQAHGGTLFLDEIGSLPLESQGKLLRVLQEKELERLGGNRTIKVDIRLIAATNKDLARCVAEGTFREDLFYRLNVYPIYLPPLRERGSDILLLANYFLEKFSRQYGKDIVRISTPAIDALMRYHWPGNIRELENTMERAVILCDDRVIRSYHLPPTLQMAEHTGTQQQRSLKEAVVQLEKELIVDALKSSRGNVRKASKMLQSTERILGYKIKKYGIVPSQFK